MQRQPLLAMHGALFLAATAIACSSDETTAPPESIQIAVSAPLVSVQRGGTISLTASLIRGGGFDGPVTLAVSGLPNGVSVTLAPDELTGVTSTAIINLVVSSTAATGSYTITVTASATIDDVETTYVLRITDPPDFSLSAASDVSVAPGNAVSTTIQITRVGEFDGAVSLTVAAPLPTGIQGALQPAITTGNSSTLTLTVATSVAPGLYLIPVYGTSEPLPTHVVNIKLTVTSTAPPDFELVVEPSALTVKPGETVTGMVRLIPIGGYDKYADLSLVSPPAGITAVFHWYYDHVASMDISVAATVARGTYQMTVKGSAEVGTHTASFTLTVTDAMDFALVLNPTALSIGRGSSGAVNIGITRVGGYSGTVTLSLVNPPAGITATFTPITVSANSASMTLTVSASVPLQTYTLVVRGTGTLIGSRDATVRLTVLAAPPGFSLDVPPAMTVVRGNSAYTLVQIVRRGGYAGAVTFTLAGPLPNGIQGEFQPAITAGNSVALTLMIATSAVVGQYPITINATSGTFPVSTATIALNVTATQGPDFELVVSPNTLTVKAGYSVLGGILLLPYNGYDRYADLSLVSPPPGIRALFEWYYGWVAAMTIYVAPTVAPGTYAIVLKGTAEVGTHTTSFTLIVTAADAFSLVRNPAAWQGIPHRH